MSNDMLADLQKEAYNNQLKMPAPQQQMLQMGPGLTYPVCPSLS